MQLTGKIRLQKKKQEHTYQTGGSNHMFSSQNRQPQASALLIGVEGALPKALLDGLHPPYNILVQPDFTGSGSIEVTHFPPLRWGSILHLNTPHSERLQLFPHQNTDRMEGATCLSLACPYQTASLLPSYHSTSSSSTEITTNIRPPHSL